MISITFTDNIANDSLQIGDLAYFVPNPTSTALGGFNRSATDPILIGDITDISFNTIQVNNTSGMSPTASDFIMFAKESSINVSGLVGYFAEVELRNNSKEKAEIYTVSSDITVSSK